MGFSTLIDYSRQLIDQNTQRGYFTLTTDSATTITGWKTRLYMSANTSVWSPYFEYNTKSKAAAFQFPTQPDTGEHYPNKLSFNLNSGAVNNGGHVYFGAQNTGFYYDPNNWAALQSTASFANTTLATAMVIGSGTTSASTAFTVSVYTPGANHAPKVGFSVDDGLNVRIGERSLSATSKIYLSESVLSNVETEDTLKIGDDGQIGTAASLRHLKQNIDYEYDSSWLYDLKPVQFEFKKYPGRIQYGLIAEDVKETNSHFAKHNSDGTLRGVKDEMLASVVLKELIELRKNVDPSFKQTYEKDKVKVVSSDFNIIHDGIIIARGEEDVKLTISDELSGLVRIKSLTNTTVYSNRKIDEKWNQMELENGSSISLLCHDNFIYILSSDGDKIK